MSADLIPRLPKGASTEERFWSKVQLGSGCHVWLGARNKDGYGEFWDGTYRDDGRPRIVRAHRFAWFLGGGELAPGEFVLHSCDNPPCVRFSDLFAGTPGVNARDRAVKGRSGRPSQPGERNPMARLNADKVRQIRAEAARGCRQTELAVRFGITQGHVNDIVARRRWAHV